MQPLLRVLATDFYWVLRWNASRFLLVILRRRMPTKLASLGPSLAFVCGVLCLLLDLRTTYEANRCCIACFSKILHYATKVRHGDA